MNLPEPLQLESLLRSLLEFHFIRPYWLFMFVPALLMALLVFMREKNNNAWQQHIEPVLLAPLLDGTVSGGSKKLPILIMIFWSICALALAGPAWEKLPTPVEKRDAALIVLLDLSPSMLANDVKPSRLIAARHKILDLLHLRKEGYSALIAYSGDAHVVSPLTDDIQTIANLLNVLEPGMMPVYGSNLEDAITKALALFKNSGYTQGDIVLLTDGVTEQAIANTTPRLNGSEYTLSIIGIGTAEGAPIPDNTGGFVKDNKGVIILPRLDESQLMTLAKRVDGYYSALRLDDRDIQPLVEGHRLFNQVNNSREKSKKTERKFDQWRDAGGILSLLLIPLLLMAFRRGVLFSLIVALPLLHTPNTRAETTDQSYLHLPGWDELWLNDNQRAMKAMRDKKYEAAAKQFSDPDWKAAAQYEAGDYASALKQFRSNSSANGFYNQGNALAKSGELLQAIAAYKEALKKNPQLEDAAYNKKIVEDLLKDQQKQENQQQDKDDKNPSGEKSQSQESDDAENNDKTNEQSRDQPENNDAGQKNQAEPNQDEQQNAHEEKDETKSDAEAQMEKSDSGKDQPEQSAESNLTPEQKQALEQWLRQVPDDPSGLLRNKFEYYYQQRLQQQESGAPGRHLNDEERW